MGPFDDIYRITQQLDRLTLPAVDAITRMDEMYGHTRPAVDAITRQANELMQTNVDALESARRLAQPAVEAVESMRQFAQTNADSLESTRRLAQPAVEAVESMRQLAQSNADSLESTRRLAQPTVEAVKSMRQLAQTNADSLESTRRLAQPAVEAVKSMRQLAQTNADALESTRRLAQPAVEAVESMRQLAQTNAHAMESAGGAAESISRHMEEMHQQMPSIGDFNLVAEQMREFEAFSRAISTPENMNLLPNLMINDLAFSLQVSAVRSMWLKQQTMIESAVGVLSALSSSPLAGTLTWPGTTKQDWRAPIHSGVWSSARPRTEGSSLSSRTVEIACEVHCLICGEWMIAKGASLFLTHDGEVHVKLSVFPLCPSCTRAANGSREYWADAASKVLGVQDDRPRYLLIEGGGLGHEPPRGREILSLVQED